jgi:PHP family Zn ribbon phosphoesterase
MIPPLIVKQAQSLGLGIIAVTDHHTADNVQAVQQAAEGSGIAVLPGMEVQTREEVDLVCLFDTLGQVLTWQETVYDHLPQESNRPEVFGAQFVVDKTGEFVRMNERLLVTSTDFPIEEVVSRVRTLGGLTLAAHIDRPSYSLLANLGVVPPDLALAALELSSRTMPGAFLAQHPELRGWTLIVSGDAHRLGEMRAHTLVTMAEPCIAELALALAFEAGRRVRVVP